VRVAMGEETTNSIIYFYTQSKYTTFAQSKHTPFTKILTFLTNERASIVLIQKLICRKKKKRMKYKGKQIKQANIFQTEQFATSYYHILPI